MEQIGNRCYRCGEPVCGDSGCSTIERRRVSVQRVNGGHTSTRSVRICANCKDEESA